MAQFDTFFTGKGLSTPIPKTDTRGQERMSDFIVKAAELKFNTYRENAKEFQANALIEPEFVLADSARKNTARQISEFNKEYGSLWAKKAGQGGLSEEDKLNMATKKALIISQNQDDVATMQRYQSMKQAVYSNPDKYDVDEFMFEEAKYIDEGKFDLVAPPTKGIPLVEIFNTPQNQFSSGTPTNVITTRTVDGAELKETMRTYGTEEQGREWVKTTLLGNANGRKGAVQEFQQLSIEEKKKYLDVDQSGTISPAEAKAGTQYGNPIIRWAQDNYWEQALKKDLSAPSTMPRETVSKGITVSIGGQDIDISPATKRTGSVTYGDKTYTDSYAFGGNITLYNLPTLGGLRYRGRSSRELKYGNITGRLKDYIPSEDMIIIEASTGIPELDIETKGLVAIPAKNVEGVDNLPVIKDGKQTTIGEIKKGQPSQSVETPAQKAMREAKEKAIKK